MIEKSDIIYKKCFEKWGVLSQILILAEESAELTQASLGLQRASKQKEALDHLAEEIADVEIMIDEMKYFFHELQSKVDAWKEEKLKRLEERLN